MKFGRSWAATAGTVLFALALIAVGQRARADVLTVRTSGTIEPACSITVKDPLPPADITNSGRVQGSALLNCNTGFVMTATSANGALKNDTVASRGFTNRLNYLLHIFLPLTGTATRLISSCNSAFLVAGNSLCSLSPGGSGVSSGGKPAIGTTATITVVWATPTKPRLIAGAYHDTVSISVTAAP